MDMMALRTLVGETMPEDPEKVLSAPLSEHGAARSFINRETPDNPAYAQMIKAMKNAAFAGAELSLVDTGLSGEGLSNPHISRQRVAEGTVDFTKGAAMTRQQAIQAIESGIEMAGEWIEKGKKLFTCGNLSLGSSMAACGVIAGLKSECGGSISPRILDEWRTGGGCHRKRCSRHWIPISRITTVARCINENRVVVDMIPHRSGFWGVSLARRGYSGRPVRRGCSLSALRCLESSLQSVMASECFSGNRRQEKRFTAELSLTGVST